MSLIQEFIDEHINKHPSSIIIEQLQVCHSAVEDLLINLQSMREMPKLEYISDKISKCTIFLAAKQKILLIIQKTQSQSLSDWLVNERISSSLIIQLIKRQQYYVDDMINKIIKKIFLSDQKLQQYLQDIEMVNNCLGLLNSLKEDLKNNKAPNRQKIKLIDAKDGQICMRIQYFQQKTMQFNLQINSLVEQLLSFQAIVTYQFKSYFLQAAQPKMLEIQDQPVYQMVQPTIQGSNTFYQPTFSKTVQGSGLNSQGRSQFKPETSQNWRRSKLNNKNEISNLGLNSQISINTRLGKEDLQRHSQLQRIEQLKLKSTFGVR